MAPKNYDLSKFTREKHLATLQNKLPGEMNEYEILFDKKYKELGNVTTATVHGKLCYDTKYTFGKFNYITYEYAINVRNKPLNERVKAFWKIEAPNVTDKDKMDYLHFLSEYIEKVSLRKTAVGNSQIEKEIGDFNKKYCFYKEKTSSKDNEDNTSFKKKYEKSNYGELFMDVLKGMLMASSAYTMKGTKYSQEQIMAKANADIKEFCDAAITDYNKRFLKGEIKLNSIDTSLRNDYADLFFINKFSGYAGKLNKCTRFWQNKGSNEFINMEKAYKEFMLAFNKSISFSKADKNTKMKVNKLLENKLEKLYSTAYIYKNKIEDKCRYGRLLHKFEQDKLVINDSKYAKRYDFADSILKDVETFASQKNIKLPDIKKSSFIQKLDLKLKEQQRQMGI